MNKINSVFGSCAHLKVMARGQLLGKYPLAAAAFMSVLMMTIVLRLFFAALIDSRGGIGFILSTVVSFIISLLLGIINVGTLLMALKICCREPVSITDIFYGFNYYPEKIVRIQAVLSGVNIIALLPATILRNIYESAGDAEYFTMIIVFYAAGLSVYFFVSLVLSQVFFLLLDFEEKSAKELMIMAYMIMNGHKKRLFFLWLSFVPLLLLGVFTCFIGFIWVIPFIKVTLANFYMDLMQNSRDTTC